jgi:hypothetical protein
MISVIAYLAASMFAPERRIARRFRVSKEGLVHLPYAGQQLSVSIMNMSAGGMALQVPDSVWLPREFDLVVKAEQLRYRVMIRWRRSELVGVQFVGEPEHV